MTKPARRTPRKDAMPTKGITTSSVRDVMARAAHLREVIAIVRAASVEFVGRFTTSGERLPELLLQCDGAGARPATVEAIIAAETALEGIARELEARAAALLALSVGTGEAVHQMQGVMSIGTDQVVQRDHLWTELRPPLQKKPASQE